MYNVHVCTCTCEHSHVQAHREVNLSNKPNLFMINYVQQPLVVGMCVRNRSTGEHTDGQIKNS
jgi:hypothetical protein